MHLYAKSMYIQVKLLAIVPTLETCTVYFFYHGQNIVLPMKIKNCYLRFLLKNIKNVSPAPDIYDTISRVISACNGYLQCVILYLYRDGIYYSYLRVGKGEKVLDINCSFEDSLVLSIALRVPFYINEDILQRQGFKITKELLKRSLTS